MEIENRNLQVAGATASQRKGWLVRFGGATDQGGREENQDAFLVLARNPELVRENRLDADCPIDTVLIVTDGMGGHAGGQAASRAVVEGLRQRLKTRELARIRRENSIEYDDLPMLMRRVIEDLKPEVNATGGGATLTMLAVKGDDWCMAFLGDSRGYRWSRESNQVTQVTRDHKFGPKGGLNNGLGAQFPSFKVDLEKGTLKSGDLFCMHSDGANVLGRRFFSIYDGRRDLQKAAREMVAQAVKQDGSDNATLVVAQFFRPDDTVPHAVAGKPKRGLTIPYLPGMIPSGRKRGLAPWLIAAGVAFCIVSAAAVALFVQFLEQNQEVSFGKQGRSTVPTGQGTPDESVAPAKPEVTEYTGRTEPIVNESTNLVPTKGLYVKPTGMLVRSISTGTGKDLTHTHSEGGCELFIDAGDWGTTKEYTISNTNVIPPSTNYFALTFPPMPIDGLALSSALSPADNATMRDPGHRSYSPRLVVSLPLGGELELSEGSPDGSLSSTNDTDNSLTRHTITGIKWGQTVSFSYGLPGGNTWNKTIRIPSIDDVRRGADVNEGNVALTGLEDAQKRLDDLHTKKQGNTSPGKVDDIDETTVNNWKQTATELPPWLSVDKASGSSSGDTAPPPEPEEDFPLTKVAVSIPTKSGPPALTIEKHHVDETVTIDGKEWATGTAFPLPGKKWGNSVSLRIENKRGGKETRNITLQLPPGLKEILDNPTGRKAEDIRASYEPWKNYLSNACNRQFTDLLRPPTSELIHVAVTKAGPPKFKLKLDKVPLNETVLSEVVVIGGRSLTHRDNSGVEYTLAKTQWGATVAYTVRNANGVKFSRKLTIPLQGGSVLEHVGITSETPSTQMKTKRDQWAQYLGEEHRKVLDEAIVAKINVEEEEPADATLEVFAGKEESRRPWLKVATKTGDKIKIHLLRSNDETPVQWLDTRNPIELRWRKWGEEQEYKVLNAAGITKCTTNITLSPPGGIKALMGIKRDTVWTEMNDKSIYWKEYINGSHYTDLVNEMHQWAIDDFLALLDNKETPDVDGLKDSINSDKFPDDVVAFGNSPTMKSFKNLLKVGRKVRCTDALLEESKDLPDKLDELIQAVDELNELTSQNISQKLKQSLLKKPVEFGAKAVDKYGRYLLGFFYWHTVPVSADEAPLGEQLKGGSLEDLNEHATSVRNMATKIEEAFGEYYSEEQGRDFGKSTNIVTELFSLTKEKLEETPLPPSR